MLLKTERLTIRPIMEKESLVKCGGRAIRLH